MSLPAMQHADISGVKLEIRSIGAGEPVVFVHGSMGDECFAVLAEPSLAERYRLIDYHRRGYGASKRPEAPVPIAQQAADCKAVMQHLGVERAHLVGQSYGGVIILQVALDAPELVHTLSLLEPALPSILFNSPEFGELAAKVTPLYASGDRSGAIDTFGQEVCGADFRELFDHTLPPGNFERWVEDADTVFQSDMPALQPWQFTRQDATRITQPVLNLRGANTTSYFRDIYETVQMWLPQAESAVVPQASHAMMQTNPKATAEILANFLSNHR
jgi:pimeloyl-ACP methyl ester carboxylesterase